MDFYFVNSEGQKVDFGSYPYLFQSGNLLDWQFSYTSVQGAQKNRTYGYRRNIREYSAQVAVLCDFSIPLEERREQWKEAVNYLVEVFSKDLINGQNGKLYTDTGYYLRCKIVASTKSDWKMGLPVMFNDLKILADNPVWIREKKRSFFPGEQKRLVSSDLNYPYNYAYNYSMPSSGIDLWDTEHFAPSPFQMIIFGPCTDPRILINGHPYEVFDTLESGDYIIIDSQENTVMKYRNNGVMVNLFDLRGKEFSVFEPIPGDVVTVTWNGSFGFDITLFEERSEPAW